MWPGANVQKIVNKKLLDEILPHEDEHTRNDWIDKCVQKRRLFEPFDEPEFFADNGQTYNNPSCVSIVHLYVVIHPITSHLQFAARLRWPHSAKLNNYSRCNDTKH